MIKEDPISRLTNYIQAVVSDTPRRPLEALLIVLLSFGPWTVGAITLLTWPLRHLF